MESLGHDRAVRLPGRSDLLAVDFIHLRNQLLQGEIDLAVLIVPSDKLGRYLTDGVAKWSEARRHIINNRADEMPFILMGIEHDGPGPALEKKKYKH